MKSSPIGGTMSYMTLEEQEMFDLLAKLGCGYLWALIQDGEGLYRRSGRINVTMIARLSSKSVKQVNDDLELVRQNIVRSGMRPG